MEHYQGGLGRGRPLHPSRHAREFYTFATAAATNFWQTASIAPSSPKLVSAMIGPCVVLRPRVVVELGIGTGAITRGLLLRLPPDSVLIGLEINHRLVRYVTRQVMDRRLVIVQESAEHLSEILRHLGHSEIDAVISSLGLTGMEPRSRNKIVESISAAIRPGGVFTQYQYVYSQLGSMQISPLRFRRFDEWGLLRRYFLHVERSWVGWNLPPAFVFTCRK
jgi:phospholipid N-methyltransferase